MLSKVFFFLLVIGLLFLIRFQDNIFRRLPIDKIWVHRVNSISKLKEVEGRFSGVELDLVFNSQTGVFDVNHPPAKSINLSLVQFFKSHDDDLKIGFWLDTKNLSKENCLAASLLLDSVTNVLGYNHEKIIVESLHPEVLKPFSEKGFLTSYYLPPGLKKLNEEALDTKLAEIKAKLNSNPTNYISYNYLDYSVVNSGLPDRKKLTWITDELYQGLNVRGFVSLIIGAYDKCCLFFDEDVEVILVKYYSVEGDR